jgi:phosphoglycolate phosphatase
MNSKDMKEKIQKFLSRFSFRTGMIVLILCIPCYIISFAQMALPISNAMKGVLWFIFFGLAKTFQYGGLSIIGVEGVKRIKNYWKEQKNKS